MRPPKGFGKNYFTLNAITATVNQISLDADKSQNKDKNYYKTLNNSLSPPSLYTSH